jgi:FG-GAP repeat
MYAKPEQVDGRSSDHASAIGAWLLLLGAHAVFAQAAPAVVQLSTLSTAQGWILDGTEPGARAASALNGDCDVDGDGNLDVLVGANGAGPNDQGMVFVVFGTASGVAPPSSLNSAGLRITGELSGDGAGASVACAGDVLNTGAAYLVYGGENLPSTMGLGSAGMRINGIISGQKLGAVLAAGGDINGDGYTDLLLTAPNFNSSATNPGQAYVIFGNASLPATFDLQTLNGSNGFAVRSTESSTLSLGKAAAIGQVNGDNFPDVVIGTPGAAPGGVSSAGSVFVVYGHSGAFPAQIGLNTLNGSNGFAIHSAIAAGNAGGSLSFVSDFNGDQRADLVIGAPGAANGLSAIGHGYILFGAMSFASNFNLSGLNGNNGLSLTSATAGDVLGASVAGLYDINGDGLGEVLFGAPGLDMGMQDSGGAYVVFGRSIGVPANLALGTLNGSNGFRIQGAVLADFAGQSAARAGDLNRDGIADLLLGAPEVDANSIISTGRVYVLFGNDFISNDSVFGNGFEQP